MIWVAITAFIISFFVFAYYYDKGESEIKSIDMSVEGHLIGYFGSLVILFISFLFIFYTIINMIFVDLSKLGSLGLVILVSSLFFLIYKLNKSLKKDKKN
jgi:hypothetical protein